MKPELAYEEFQQRLNAVRQRMQAACERAGRPVEDVRLMAVTKTHPAWAVDYAARAGLECIGENRVQEAATKKPDAQSQIRWELIGSLQSNKAKQAVELFGRIQSVDRPKLVRVLEQQCEKAGRERLPILLEINAGNDPAKHGADIDAAPALLEAALECPRLAVEGLMTIAPLSDDPAVARACFAALRELRERLAAQYGLSLAELSMGMSGDMEDAILEGSTLIRVGTALFGARE